MRRALLWTLSTLLLFFSGPAYACGGGFGDQVMLNPLQNIVLTYRGGEETYLFQPHFCGAATDFGLILPVPSTLTHDPTLGDAALVSQLQVVTAPAVETVEVCASSGIFGRDKTAGMDQGAAAGVPRSVNSGVNVISAGQVGVFQWQLLKADSTQSFTDWLDASNFPYPATAAPAFDHYVQAGWYFVAFSVTAGDTAPPAGTQLCGDFGPIQLSFQTSQAVIPARIAAAGDTTSTFDWGVFTISAHELNASTGSNSVPVSQTVLYAGALSTNDLAGQPAVAAIGNAGEWLTELDLNFYAGNLTQDIWLEQPSVDTSFRRTEYVEKEVTCGVFGCSIDRNSGHQRGRLAALIIMAGFALAIGVRRLNSSRLRLQRRAGEAGARSARSVHGST